MNRTIINHLRHYGFDKLDDVLTIPGTFIEDFEEVKLQGTLSISYTDNWHRWIALVHRYALEYLMRMYNNSDRANNSDIYDLQYIIERYANIILQYATTAPRIRLRLLARRTENYAMEVLEKLKLHQFKG